MISRALLILAVLAALSGNAWAGGEIYGGSGPTYEPTWQERYRAVVENEARMQHDIAECKAGTLSGTQCHMFCRDDDYALGAHWCDRWGNFRVQP